MKGLTLEINKQNWTGEKGKVTLLPDGRLFQVYDQLFKIEETKHEAQVADDGMEIYPAYSSYKVYEINEDGSDSETDWKGETDVLNLYGGGYVFFNWTREIYRNSSQDPRLAAAQLIFNVY